jgi:hypothetical protein
VIADDHVIEQFCEGLRSAWMIARGERLGELRGKRARLLNGAGLHDYSLEIGRLQTLMSLLPLLTELDFNPVELRREAHRDAELEFEVETALRVGIENGWITPVEAAAIQGESADGRKRWVPQVGIEGR